MPGLYAHYRHMRTTVVLDDRLLGEAKKLSGARTKQETIHRALDELVRSRRTRKLLGMAGKVELSMTRHELLRRRKRDTPYPDR